YVRLSQAAQIAQPAAATASPPAAVRTSKSNAATVNSTPAEPAMAKRYFEFVDDKSSKFWEIAVAGNEVTVRFGRIDTNGQTQTKTFGDAAAAQKHADKLIGEKTEKGYVEK